MTRITGLSPLGLSGRAYAFTGKDVVAVIPIFPTHVSSVGFFSDVIAPIRYIDEVSVLLQEFWVVESPDSVSPSEPIRESLLEVGIYFPVIRTSEVVRLDERVDAIQDLYILLCYDDHRNQIEPVQESWLDNLVIDTHDVLSIDIPLHIEDKHVEYKEDYEFCITLPVIYHNRDIHAHRYDAELMVLDDLHIESGLRISINQGMAQKNIHIILGLLSKHRNMRKRKHGN